MDTVQKYLELTYQVMNILDQFLRQASKNIGIVQIVMDMGLSLPHPTPTHN